MGKIYAVANRKGGCGKTSTTGAMASGLRRRGLRVLVVDTDPQGNLTDWTRVDTEDANTTFEVVTRRCSAADAIVATERYDILPSDEVLAQAEHELASVQGRERRLAEALKAVADNYDVILVDTPPQLGMLSIMAFAAADGGVLVVTDAGAFATKGMDKLSDTLAATREYFNPNAKVVGIMITRFSARMNAMKAMAEVTQRFADYFDAPLYKTFVRQSVGVMEAQINGEDIYEVKDSAGKNSIAATDYMKLVEEFSARENLPLN